MSNTVDEFEHAFQSCITALTSPSSNYAHDSEEVKTSVDQTVQRFLDSAKAMESFFLQKRLYLSVHKPELLVAEDIAEIKTEIQRKDAVIQRFQEKLQTWQLMLSEQPNPPANHPLGHSGHHPSIPTGIPQIPTQGIPSVPGSGMMSMRPQHAMPAQPHSMQTPGMSLTGPQMHGMSGGIQRMQGPHPGAHMMSGGVRGPISASPGQMAYQAPGMQHHVSPGFMVSQSSPSPGQQPQTGQQQSPLAYLERTTSNIGLPETRR